MTLGEESPHQSRSKLRALSKDKTHNAISTPATRRQLMRGGRRRARETPRPTVIRGGNTRQGFKRSIHPGQSRRWQAHSSPFPLHPPCCNCAFGGSTSRAELMASGFPKFGRWAGGLFLFFAHFHCPIHDGCAWSKTRSFCTFWGCHVQ